MHTRAIGSAMRDGLIHRVKNALVGKIVFEVEDAADAAHSMADG
jgi:hypothetical protein